MSIERDFFIREKLIRVAKEHARKTRCPKCKNKIKIIPLNELPTVVPTEVLAFCKKCKFNDSLSNINEDFKKHLESICNKLSRVLKRSSGEDITKSGIIIPKK